MRYNRPSFSASYSIKVYSNISIDFVKIKGYVKVKIEILEFFMNKLENLKKSHYIS